MNVMRLDSLIEKIVACVARHELVTGCYARWTFGEGRSFDRNEYGCADAANILYTVGRFPRDPDVRAEWVRHLREMQDPETGLYREATHHPIHTTAHCVAALELFDAKPLYAVAALERYITEEGLYELLENEVNWQKDPWSESHKGAGILAALSLTDMVDLSWKNRYFEWLWEHSDPETGFFWSGERVEMPLFRHMAGGFHYLFNHEVERRPFRYPEAIIDSCLQLMAERPEDSEMLRWCGFIDVDVVYSLSRAMRQTPHRFDEGKAALEAYAEAYLAMLNAMDDLTDPTFNDLHCLFGAVCCLAELQQALPGKLLSTKPLRLVLDRRPFI